MDGGSDDVPALVTENIADSKLSEDIRMVENIVDNIADGELSDDIGMVENI